MTAVTLRDAREADAEVLFDMLGALAREVGEGREFVASLADVRRDGFGPSARYETILAEADGEPLGLVAFFPTYSTYKGRPCLHVNDLYVAPAARERGLARRLMARVCRLAVERGCCRVELKVLDSNRARDFYESIGMGATAEVAYSIRDQALADLAAED